MSPPARLEKTHIDSPGLVSLLMSLFKLSDLENSISTEMEEEEEGEVVVGEVVVEKEEEKEEVVKEVRIWSRILAGPEILTV